jgi:hypothetical protein
LWFSFNFDISIICFIISCGFGWPLGAAAEVVAAAGDSAEVCANEGATINVVDRIVIKSVGIFMAGFCQRPTAIGKWQVRSREGKGRATNLPA